MTGSLLICVFVVCPISVYMWHKADDIFPPFPIKVDIENQRNKLANVIYVYSRPFFIIAIISEQLILVKSYHVSLNGLQTRKTLN